MLSPVFDLPPGTYISERYKILKTLGQGGFGITYVAWDAATEKRVAVKECFPDGLCVRETQTGAIKPARPEWEHQYLNALNDMRKEVRTLTGLDHEGIVRINDVIWGNGGVFCVMPWLQGGTLREKMVEGGMANYSVDQSITWLRMLLDALRYLHNRGIVHRDIKPTNIMFDAAGNPIIIDFGAALNRPERTTSTTTQGAFSRSYAAPEQITGKGRIGPWTDFYSLAATWYELLTGILPEDADARLMQDDLVPLSRETARLDYPEELLRLLNCNMSLRPIDRCRDVDQWLQCWDECMLPREIIKRTHRSRLIIECAVFGSLGLGITLGLWAAFSKKRADDATLALSAEQATLPAGELTRILNERVGNMVHLNEYNAMCDRYTQRFEKCLAEQVSCQLSLLEKLNAELEHIKSSKEAQDFCNKIRHQSDELLQEQSDQRSSIATEFEEEHKSYVTSTDEMAKLLPPRTQQEEMLLPSVCNDISYKMTQRFTLIMAMLYGVDPDKETSFISRIADLYGRAAGIQG